MLVPFKKKASVLLATAIATAFNAQAAEQAQASEEIENVEIWGTRVKASSVNMDEEHMAIRQADHISDLLRTIPGVDVGGAHSLNQRIAIRSLDDKDLRITIDGANQNTYMYHHMGNLQIHADILESVDVEIGTNSVINGGLGGAVRFDTKSAKQLLDYGESFGARIQASHADNGGDSWSLTGYGQLQSGVDFLFYHNDVSRDNYEVGGGEILDFNGDKIPDTDGKVRGLKGDITDTLLKLGWDLSDNHRFELGYEAYEDTGNYSYRPDMGLATDLAVSNSIDAPLTWPTEFTRDTLTLNYDGQFGDTSVKLAIYSNESTLARDETGYLESDAVVRGTPVADWAAYITGDADNRGLNLLAETQLDAHTLTYGFEYVDYQTEYRADYLIGDVDQAAEEAQTTSLFLQDRYQLTDTLAIIPGIRYDAYDMDATLVSDKFSDVTGALAAEYAISNDLLVKLSTTQLFKAPEIGEVFVGAGLFDKPNPDIEAETGYNSELSLAYESDALGADSFSFGFTLFQTEIEDYIYDYAGRKFKDNVGDMQIDGGEAYLGYERGALQTLLTYSTAESELDAAEEYADLDGARIDREQGDTISLSVDYRLEALDLVLHWDMLNVDDLDSAKDLDGASVDRAKDGFTVHNISARWTPQVVDGLSVTLGVDNLTDEFYSSHSSRTGLSNHPLFGELYLLDYEPGRNVKMTLAYQF